MGDRLWTGKLSRYVTSQLGQLSLSSLRPIYSDTTQLNSTDLLRADWLYATTGSVALPIAGDSWVASVRVSIATQLNSTELNSTSSWVELRRYKRAFTGSINRVPTCPVGVKAGRSPLSGGIDNTVWSHWQVASRSSEVNFTKNYALLYLYIYFLFSLLTVGQSSLIYLAHHCYDWHPGSHCG